MFNAITPTPSACYSILIRHAREEVSSLRLLELCRDDDRVASLVAVYNTTYTSFEHQQVASAGNIDNNIRDDGYNIYTNHAGINNNSNKNASIINNRAVQENRVWIVDLSRQRMTDSTLNHLLRLAVAVRLKDFITQMSWGQNNPNYPVTPNRLRPSKKKQHQNQHHRGKESSNNPQQQKKQQTPSKHYTQPKQTTEGNRSNSDLTYSQRWEAINVKRLAEMEASSSAAADPIKDKDNDKNHNRAWIGVSTDSNGIDDGVRGDDGGDVGVGTIEGSNLKMKSSSRSSNRSRDYTPCPSMHMAMRVPNNVGYEMLLSDGTNALIGIHNEWNRIQRFAESIRKGQARSSTGAMLYDVVVVGQGVAIKVLQFVYHALCYDEQAVLGSMWNMPSATSAASSTDVTQLSTAANRLLNTVTGGANSILTGNSPDPRSKGGGSNNSVRLLPRRRKRRMRFVTTVDPIAAIEAVSDLDPASTFVISAALSGSEETSVATKALKSWMLQALAFNNTVFDGPAVGSSGGSVSGTGTTKTDQILSKHMILITGNDRIASVANKPESVYVIPDHSRCEAFCNFSAITLLPLSIVFGWPVVRDYLNGGHDLDQHFINEKPRHNLPILLALTDVWNTIYTEQQQQQMHLYNHRPLTSCCIRAIKPYTEAFKCYPSFVGALEAQVCTGTEKPVQAGGVPDRTTESLVESQKSVSSMIVDCGLDGSYDRAFYERNTGTSMSHSSAINCELIMSMDSQVAFQTESASATSQSTYSSSFTSNATSRFYTNVTGGSSASSSHGGKSHQKKRIEEDIQATQDAVICSLFAHADELAFGNQQVKTNRRYVPTSSMASSSESLSSSDPFNSFPVTGPPSSSDGNRPSVVLLTSKLDAFACGQLVSLSEHRAVVKARLWGLDPFAMKQQVGSAPRMERTDHLQVELQKLLAKQDQDNVDDEEGVEVRVNNEHDYDDDDDDDLNHPNPMILSTKTLLELYANVMKEERRVK